MTAGWTLSADQGRSLATLCGGNRALLGVAAQVATRQRRSLEWHARSLESVSAGRSQLPYFSPLLPICALSAAGSHLRCLDGHDYIDAHMGYTAGILGHNPPQVVEGLREALGRRPGAGYFVQEGVELAELVRSLVPGLERVAFLHSGADAVEAALRLARAHTRRGLIAKFEGCYHGWHESGLVNTALTWAGRTGEGPLGAIVPQVATGGLPPSAGADYLILPYGDELAYELIERHAHELAGVLLDPVPRFMMNDLAGARAFTQRLRDLTLELGIPLICDEVVTGFRLAPGGIAEAFDVQPDLSVFGKITAGLGLPLSMVGGRAEIMNRASTAGLLGDYLGGKVWISTTHAANSLALSASLLQLRSLKAAGPELFAPLDAHHAHVGAQVQRLSAELGIPIRLDGHPRLYSMLGFQTDPPDPAGVSPTDARNPARAYYRSFTPGNVRAARLLTLYLRLQGVYMETLPTLDLSAAHTADDAARIVAGLETSLRAMQGHGAFS
ncbi:aminotransferase class III-fold pyridoxal phosphate-dependent enzyme [Deinococcus sp.]|uniref:aminotransferase class III-fold pyridoxal phosphate-dependent enzyme n=1 Tax=Deinococcus sp. TaxID=47478 RepID=UPI003CC51BD2